MTKQHFIRAAQLVRSIRDGNWTNDFPAWFDRRDVGQSFIVTAEHRAVMTAEAFIALFSEFNPRFDRTRFLVACGLVESPVKPRKARAESGTR